MISQASPIGRMVGLSRIPRALGDPRRCRGEEDRAPAVWRDRHREDSLAELVSEGIAASPLAFVVRAAAALDELEREDAPVEVMFFCVPTPMGVGGIADFADLAAVEAVIEEIHDVLPAGAVVNQVHRLGLDGCSHRRAARARRRGGGEQSGVPP